MAAKEPRQIRNPLTLIAVFAGLAEIAATGVLPVLKGEVQSTFVWYVMFFPILLVVAFFVTLNFNHRVLYAPTDFRDERHFLETLTATFSSGADEMEALRKYWKPGGSVNRRNERRLKGWLKSNGLDTESVTFFLRNELFSDARRRAVSDLGLQQEYILEIQRVLTDVPEEEVNELVSDFESEGATITKEKQPDGKWTIRATFLDNTQRLRWVLTRQMHSEAKQRRSFVAVLFASGDLRRYLRHEVA